MNSFGIVNFGLFCAAVLLLNATPGPDTAYIVGRSVAQGRAAGLVSALGISFGCLFHCLASAFGLTAILAASATAFTLIKLAGGIYLIYLGVRMALAKPVEAAAPSSVKDERPLNKVFWQAAVTNVLNPKVILFFLSFFPQFVLADSQHKTTAFLLLGAAFVVMSTIWNSGTAFLAGTLARRAGRNPRIKLWLERFVGSAFVALGIKLATAKH
ncbi:LysE family translocator [Undibacterium sp. TJN25]|uniref:LysE family translocator n=1 Tax=Undibacterium sp. TJN25 TaxID=3413056 RepID=UPI003BF08FB7